MNSPFRVLYRLFLFRITDVEFLSAHAKGDSTKLLGQFAALLVFLSLLFSMAAAGVPGKKAHPQMRLMFEWSSEHFLIATTMLVVGLFAVLNWESVLPDRRDVIFVGPLPVTTRTLFLAKITAVAAALATSVGLLHVVAGLVWPFALNAEASESVIPSFRASPPVAIRDRNDLKPILERDLAAMLAERPEAGLVIGVLQGGIRRTFAFGSANPDSIFEIGSVTKTFTGLLLAQMVLQGEVSLHQPVRELFPDAAAHRPFGAEITLLDLATHRSGLPSMPGGFRPADRDNPFADFHDKDLHAFLNARGFAKRGNPRFYYSNLGFGLLGRALANRAGRPFSALVEERIVAPLGLRDTSILLSANQRARLIQGHNWRHRPVRPWDLDSIDAAGALHSSADDILSYLAAQLHPEQAVTNPTLAAALKQSQKSRANLGEHGWIALAWFVNAEGNRVFHGGATAGHTALASFSPARDEAIVVLSNTGPTTAVSADLIGEHLLARMENRPSVSIENVTVPARGGPVGLVKSFAAYWVIMFGAGAFMFCAVLCLQGLAAQVLPRRLFLRLAPGLQLLAFTLIVAGYLLQPMAVSPSSILAAQSGGVQGWSPSFWFLGLFQWWRDSPVMGMLAQRAWIASAFVGTLTAIVWVSAYFRTVRQIVEEPDIMPGRARVLGLPQFGGPLQTAITQFSIRTMLRSRQHRLLLTFFTGVAFAVAIFFIKTPIAQQEIAEVATGDPWHEPTSPILASSVVVLGLWLLAVRIGFSIPFDIRANWIFQVTPLRGQVHCLAVRRRAMFVAGLLPALLLLSGACWAMWPWRLALGHTFVLGLLGAIVAEFCLSGPQQIPFTCSHLPGRTNIHVTFWLVLGLLMKILDTGAGWERQALTNPPQLLAVVVSLGLVALLVRWMTGQSAAVDGDEPQFEAEPSDAIVSLGLDGSRT